MLSLALGGMLTGIFTINLPDGDSIDVIDDPAHPWVASHELQVNTFLGSGGEGVVRMLDTLPGLHGILNAGPLASWDSDTETTQRRCFELIGTSRSPSPRVYLVNTPARVVHVRTTLKEIEEGKITPLSLGEVPDAESQLAKAKEELKSMTQASAWLGEPTEHLLRKGKRIGIRTVTAFEQGALNQLKAGHRLVQKREGATVLAVGAIRASESCLRCHDENRVGDVLGAFTYLAAASPNDNQVIRTKLAQLIQGKASDKELWIALKAEPRKLDGWFMRDAPAMQLDLQLARRGFISARLVTAIESQRSAVETVLLHRDEQRKLPNW